MPGYMQMIGSGTAVGQLLPIARFAGSTQELEGAPLADGRAASVNSM
jgi:hypothetical protein